MSNEYEKVPLDGEREEVPYFTESLKLAFDTSKQLTTLNAGSIVIIGTFLTDIFPSKSGALALGPGIKLLIAASFICFGLVLASAAYVMFYSSGVLEDYEEHLYKLRQRQQDRVWREWRARTNALLKRVRWWSLVIFNVGLFCFGFAVLLNLYR
jgi:uncharacterized ion transporter superfamily protein YfcC